MRIMRQCCGDTCNMGKYCEDKAYSRHLEKQRRSFLKPFAIITVTVATILLVLFGVIL